MLAKSESAIVKLVILQSTNRESREIAMADKGMSRGMCRGQRVYIRKGKIEFGAW